MTEFLSFLRQAFHTLVRERWWLVIAGFAGVSSLILVALTLSSEAASAPGTYPGRMALSFVVYLSLIAVMLGTPAVFIGVRDSLGQVSFTRSLVLALAVGLSLVIAVLPSVVWAIASTSIGPDVWGPTVGTAVIQVLVVSLLVALAFAFIRRDGAATATAFGLIGGLAVGPFIVLGLTTLAPGVEQTVTYSYIDYKDGSDLDPVTGFPTDPTCSSSDAQKRVVARYDLVWPVVELNPVVLVSSATMPTVVQWVDPTYPEGMPTITPIDLFGTVGLAVRSMQLTPETKIDINECELLAQYGTPYPANYGEADPDFIVANSQSGWSVGLLGQTAYLAVASVVVVLTSRRTRR